MFSRVVCMYRSVQTSSKLALFIGSVKARWPLDQVKTDLIRLTVGP